MSTINTSGIDVNYPVPGENNSTQGFRDNFANIANNFNVASSEITDLQNKAILKQALANGTLNNDMAGALLSNATVLGFRSSTYNLGNALSGRVLVDVSLGDVQYGNIAGDVTFEFGGWAPVNTESTVILKLGVSNANAVINFPTEVTSTFNGFGVTILENYSNANNVSAVTVPNGVVELDYQLKTIDCGNTIYITPLNRPFQSTQIQPGVPITTGLRGDNKGSIAIGPSVTEVTVTRTANEDVEINAAVVVMPNCSIAGTVLTVGTTDDAVMTGTITGTILSVASLISGNIQIGMNLSGSTVLVGTTIVENISASTWRVSISQTVGLESITGSTPIQPGMLLTGTGVLADTYIVSNNTGNGAGSLWNINKSQTLPGPVTIIGTTGIVENRLYVGQVASGTIKEGTVLSGLGLAPNTTVVKNLGGSGSGSVWTVSSVQFIAPVNMSGIRNAITCDSTTDFYLDMPIVFTGEVFGGLVSGATYYIKDVMTSTDFSVTLTPGGNGTTFTLTNSTGNMVGNPINYLFVSSGDYAGNVIGPKSVLNTYETYNYVRLNNVVNLEVNNPIVFVGSTFGGLTANVPFYIKSIDAGNSNVELSRTIINGIAGASYELGTASTNTPNACQAYSVMGPDIWRQIPLLPSNDQGSNIVAANLTLSDNLTVQGNTTINGVLNVTGTTSYGNISYVNITTSGNANLENIFANNITTNTLTTNGVAAFSDVSNVRIEGGLNGYFLQTDGTGNLSWVAGTSSPPSNTAAGSDTQIQFNDGGSLAGSPNLTYSNSTSYLTVGGGLLTSGNIEAAGNVTSNNLIVNSVAYFTQVANVKIAGGPSGQYLQADGSGGLVWSPGSGNVIGDGTSAGPNNSIQIGDGSGNFKAATGFTFDDSSNDFSAPGNALITSNVIAGNVYANSGTIGASLLTGTLTTSSQPNVTSLGTLSSLVVNGNVNANVLFANTGTTIDPDTVTGFAAGNIVEPVFSTLGNAGIVIGKTTGQHGAIIYSSDTMIFGTEDGNTNSLRARGKLFSNGTFESTYLKGTLLTASQPGINSIGTLTSLAVSGNASAGNFVGNLANGSSNIRIPAAGGNINVSVSGNANVLTISGIGISVSGNANIIGNLVAYNPNIGNTGVSGGYLTANGNVFGNLDVSNIVTGRGGIRGLSSTYTDSVAAANSTIDIAAAHAINNPILSAASSNVTINSAATFAVIGEPEEGTNVNLTTNNAYALYVKGKSLLAGNIVHIGNVLQTTNVNVSSNLVSSNLQVTDTAVFSNVDSVVIPGGNNGQFLQTDGNGSLVWANGTVTATGTGVANGAATQVQYSKDGTGAFGGSGNFTFNPVTNNLTVKGNLTTFYTVSALNFDGTISSTSPAQPNITSTGVLVSVTTSGNIVTTNPNAGLRTTYVSFTNEGYGNSNIANIELVFAANSFFGLKANRNRYFDNAAASSSVITNSAIHFIGQPKLAATNSSVTATNATTFYIEGAPVANANMTISNAYAFWSNGNSRINGNLIVDGNLFTASGLTISNIDNVFVGNTTAFPGYFLQTDGNGGLQWAAGTVNAGNIYAPGSTSEILFNDGGAVVGANANFTFDKTNANLNVNGNVNVTGTITAGGVTYTNVAGAAGEFLTIDGSGVTSWTAISTSASLIENGSSNIEIPISAGNINVNTTSTQYFNINGLTLINGNFYVGGSTTTAVEYIGTRPLLANSFLKSGTDGITFWDTSAGALLSNSTSNITVNASNIQITAAGNNVVTVTGTGANILAGNLRVGQVSYTNTAPATNGYILTGNTDGTTTWINPGGITTPTSIVNGTSKVEIATSGGNVKISAGAGANVIDISSANANFTGTITTTANINSANAVVSNNFVTANCTANAYIIGTGGIVTDANTSRTLSAADNGKILYFTNPSAVTLNTATSLGAGFSCVVIQGNTGKVTLNAVSGTQKRSFGTVYSTAGTYATIAIMCPVANEFFVSGQTGP